MVADNPTGIYVHVPFCIKRCDYCDFTTFAGREHQMGDYTDALCLELERLGERYQEFQLDTLFIGGGTPTLLDNRLITKVLDTLNTAFSWTRNREWTIEANPETVDADLAETLKSGGINRVSMGAQSFDDKVLQTLGRWHTNGQVHKAVHFLREAGIEQLSVDLIFGTPGETEESWLNSLETAISLGTDHLSAYALTVEPATPYGRRAQKNRALIPDEDLQGNRLRLTAQVLSDWTHYEVSNWAKTPDNRCRHNLSYWQGRDWLAAGVGATGALGNKRWWNTRSIDRYIRAVNEGSEPVGGSETLSKDDLRLEALMMGLRTTIGTPKNRVLPLDEKTVTNLKTSGLLVEENNFLRVPNTHFQQVDGIIRALV